MQSPILLDSFSKATLQKWRKQHKAAHDFQTLLYFDLEAQRVIHSEKLHDALRDTTIQYDFDSWKRIVNYRYTLHPLSSVGSLKSIGGRFNIGEDVDPKTFKSFPALYIADTDSTARAEYFQKVDQSSKSKLTVEDFMLTNQSSYSVVSLRGSITRVFDLRKKRNLKQFVEVTRNFTIAKRVKKMARIAGVEGYSVLDNVKDMHTALVDRNWRFQPMQYDVPSNSQIFGGIICMAGIQGVLYKSVRSSGTCIAVYPQNLDGHDAYVEIKPPVPAELEIDRLDWTTWRELIDE